MTSTTQWYARKPYLHFDLPLSKRKAAEYVSDPERIERHPFYPFLSCMLITPRIRRSPPGCSKRFINEPKKRNIAYPAHKDGYIFAYYKARLEAPYEGWLKVQGLDQAVTGFRRTGENNITLAKKAFDFIAANPDCQVIATDVESFFDNINHQQLKVIWARFLDTDSLPKDHYAVYKAITKYSLVERHKIYNLFGIPIFRRRSHGNQLKRLCTPQQFRENILPRNLIKPNPSLSQGVGIPQGSQLSPLLSNMYMADLDLAMHKWVSSIGGAYWRYCDDILMVTPSGSSACDMMTKLDTELQRLSLKRSGSKTQTLDHAELLAGRQLQYLGFMFNGFDAVIRPSSIHRYHRRLKKAIQAAEIRRDLESKSSGQIAPLRQQALYNMYSDGQIRGKKIKSLKKKQKFSGNFINYMAKSVGLMDSPRIKRQRKRVLRRFRSALKTRK